MKVCENVIDKTENRVQVDTPMLAILHARLAYMDNRDKPIESIQPIMINCGDLVADRKNREKFNG